MRPTAVALSVLLLAAACGTKVDPVGTYELSSDNAARVLDPSASEADRRADAFAQARLKEAGTQPDDWRIALEVKPDHRFSLTMTPPSRTRSGTWKLRGSELELTTTTDNGQPRAQPLVQTALLEGNKLRLGLNPGTAKVVLQKVAP